MWIKTLCMGIYDAKNGQSFVHVENSAQGFMNTYIQEKLVSGCRYQQCTVRLT